MNRFAANAVGVAAVLFGGGSLVLLGGFLLFGSFGFIRFSATDAQVLLWDAGLSLLFFIQHSGMVRRSFRTWLDPLLARSFHAAVYALASGLVLVTVLLFWQPSATVLWALPAPFRLWSRLFFALAVAGFIWGTRSLRDFDTFGLAPLRVRPDDRPPPAPRFMVRGPYLWVRHPLYLFVIVFIWAGPDVTADRLLFNGLWTAWIVLGARWEERDLVAAFGAAYRRYQATVPMLLPWRGPAGRRLTDGNGDGNGP